jgi:hypothetical protein
MSASWDPEREGSFFGWDEFQKNTKSIQDGLARSRENTLLRERIAMTEQTELQQALQQLNRKEQKVIAERQSFSEKLQDELD